jgi:hypothetical protein
MKSCIKSSKHIGFYCRPHSCLDPKKIYLSGSPTQKQNISGSTNHPEETTYSKTSSESE